ncbi:hypothetical protein A9Q99_14160 [Gammaproteobacteria bacterium 45_16_T64]|nr:hypothetical protein A9Q99_14160 [Gammaproteobacteria bacterium 45_16_T64]
MISIDDRWFAAEGKEDGFPILIRGRGHLKDLVGTKSHPHILRITWDYVPDENSGMPSRDLIASMASFEEAIFGALEKDNLCIFYKIYLHNGIKEWSGYCSEIEVLQEQINKALFGHEQYPIQMAIENDPEWKDYTNLLKNTGQSVD